MNMKRAVLLECLVIALTALCADAAERPPEAQPKLQPASPGQVSGEKAPSEEPPAEVIEPVIPKREVVFEESNEVRPKVFSEPDPKLLEQRYVAWVQLLGKDDAFRSLSGAELPQELRVLQQQAGLRAFFRQKNLFDLLVENVPEPRLPPEDVVAALTADARRHVTYHWGSRVTPTERGQIIEPTLMFEVLGPTPQRVKELVQGVLTLYDYGFSYTFQQEYLRQKKAWGQRLPEQRAAIEEAEKEVADWKNQLEPFQEYEDVTKEALAALVAEQRSISVDLAGVEARIEACNKILKTLADAGNLSSNRIDRVETIKITVEIEGVGLRARQAYITQIVQKVRQRDELRRKLSLAQHNLRTCTSRVADTERMIEKLEEKRQACMPFPIDGGKIVIYPIKWQAASAQDGPGRRE